METRVEQRRRVGQDGPRKEECECVLRPEAPPPVTTCSRCAKFLGLVQKKVGDTLNSRIKLVLKSGKIDLGYKSTLKSLRTGTGVPPLPPSVCLPLKLRPVARNPVSQSAALPNLAGKMVLISTNTPPLKKSEIEYYATIAKVPVTHYPGNNTELGTACGKYFRVGIATIVDPGDSDIISRPDATA